MLDRSLTPSITVTIGHHTRIYFAFITTAPAELDSPATITLHAGALSEVSGFAATIRQPLASTASFSGGHIMVVKITPNDKGNPPGKLADAELHFNDGELDGMKLIGFAIWERRSGGGRNVTFPARQYVVNGDRRSFALLRPITDTTAQEHVRELVLQAYAEYEEGATQAAS